MVNHLAPHHVRPTAIPVTSELEREPPVVTAVGVVVVPQEHVGVYQPTGLAARLAQRLDGPLPIPVVPEDRVPLVAAAPHARRAEAPGAGG